MAHAYLLALAEERRKQNLLKIYRRRLRDKSDPLQLTEIEFRANFRLSKSGFQQVLAELTPYLPQMRRTTAVSNEIKILAVLNFYANGSYQRNLGASIHNTMSQPKFSRCLHEVTNALNVHEVLQKYINFPVSQIQREIIMNDFMSKFSFPGTVGCIDGTHVAIIRPVEHEETYFNRKNYHSLNVLIICDAQLNITHVDASYGGAAHDSFVWNQSSIKPIMEELPNRERCWLLGDSGYAQRPYMMTPILGAAPGTPEEYYTDLHCKARSTVERCIGVLKARWRCLLGHRVLHYDPITAGKIVNACVVLHNIANAQNVEVPAFDDEDLQQLRLGLHSDQNAEVINDNTRSLLVQRLWEARR